MALLQEVEPPSSDETNKTNPKKQSTKFSRLLLKISESADFIRQTLSKISKSLFCWQKSVFNGFHIFFRTNRFLPHFVLIFLGIVVLVANLSDASKAYALSQDIITVDPETEYSVTNSVDHFTPLITNDTSSVIASNLSLASAEGFSTNIAPIDTQITTRVEPLPDNSGGTVYYIVRSGDTLSGLGAKFGVKVSTIQYLNDLNTVTIKPGLRLTVPKRGYEVDASLIAKKQNAQKAAAASSSSKNSAAVKVVKKRAPASINGYPFGWCTYYVASKRYVPTGWGDARRWLSSAKSAGYDTSSTPAVGAIMVTSESFRGHVTYVEKVTGSSIIISEMNGPSGFGVVGYREFKIGDSRIRGFIY